MTQKQFIAVKAVIRDEHNRILLVREASSNPDGSNAGRYDVPGGRLHQDEPWEAALRREVKEEVGLEIEVGRPLALGEWRPTVRNEQWQIVGIYIECRSKGGGIKLSQEHDNFIWADTEELRRLPLIDNVRTALQDVHTIIDSGLKIRA